MSFKQLMREKGLVGAIMTNIAKTAGKYGEPSGNQQPGLFTMARYYIPFMPTPKCRFNFDEYENSVINRLVLRQPVSPDDGEIITNNMVRLRELQTYDVSHINIYSSRLNDKTLPIDPMFNIIAGIWCRALIPSAVILYSEIDLFAFVVGFDLVYILCKLSWLDKQTENEKEIVNLVRNTEHVIGGNNRKSKAKQFNDIIRRAIPAAKE